jgi:hypothetical protein
MVKKGALLLLALCLVAGAVFWAAMTFPPPLRSLKSTLWIITGSYSGVMIYYALEVARRHTILRFRSASFPTKLRASVCSTIKCCLGTISIFCSLIMESELQEVTTTQSSLPVFALCPVFLNGVSSPDGAGMSGREEEDAEVASVVGISNSGKRRNLFTRTGLAMNTPHGSRQPLRTQSCKILFRIT